MSLINKMLQDLDARGSHAGAALPSEIKPVAMPERRLPVVQIAWAAGLLVLAMAVAAVLWLKRPSSPPVAPVMVVAAPVVMPAPAPVKVLPVVAPVKLAPPKPPAPEPVTRQAVAAPEPRPSKAAVPVVVEVEEAAPPRAVAPVAAPLAGGRVMNDAQRSEGIYRQALAALDDGRVAAALDLLGQTLKLNPRHDAARQSLVALLIEAGRNEEAMQQLEQGLAIDPGQPSLAMLLARMQIERGVSGVATLMRTLPSAAGNADYHAFLAGALQREQRHKDALVQYGAALRVTPENGVWLMGQGISLQAEKRNAEALEAFQRAKASGMLTAPLAAFVDRKVQQLTP